MFFLIIKITFITMIIAIFAYFCFSEYKKKKQEEEARNRIFRQHMQEEERKHKEYLEEKEREELRRLEQQRQEELRRRKLEQREILKNTLKILKKDYNKTDEFYNNYIVFDLQTTGLTPCEDEIIEIGAVKYENGVEISKFQSYIKPLVPISQEVTSLTGISTGVLSDAEDAENVLQRFVDYIGDSVLIAHNSDFDMNFLQTELYNYLNYLLDNKVIDSLRLAKRFLPKLDNHKLETIKKHLGINGKPYNALDNCYATAELYRYCFDRKDNIITLSKEDIVFSQFETEIFKAVTDVLKTNNLSVASIGMNRCNVYTDILYENYVMLRFKLNGKLIYWLVDMDFNTFSAKYGNMEKIKESSRSEGKKVRVSLDDLNILKQLQEYIISEYNKCKESRESYEKWLRDGKPSTYTTMITVSDEKFVVEKSSQ